MDEYDRVDENCEELISRASMFCCLVIEQNKLANGLEHALQIVIQACNLYTRWNTLFSISLTLKRQDLLVRYLVQYNLFFGPIGAFFISIVI